MENPLETIGTRTKHKGKVSQRKSDRVFSSVKNPVYTNELDQALNTEPSKMGRPTIYTALLANEILRRLSLGESLKKICDDETMPHRDTVHVWLLEKDKQDFSDKYARARELQAAFLFDETLELADNAVDDIVGGDDKGDTARVNARKLQVDTRKFYISKVLPKLYGDKLDVTTDGKPIVGNTITFVRYDEPANQ